MPNENNSTTVNSPVITLPETKIQGFVSYEIQDSEGNTLRKVNPKPQFIVDSGLNGLGTFTSTTLSQFCRVGTGTVAPNASQSTLVSQHGGASGNGAGGVEANSGAAPWWHSYTRTYTFAANTITGAALAELGFFSAATGGTMLSRFLFVDVVGDPAPITVLAGEILIVTYEIRTYVPNTDVTGSFNITINGTPTNFDYVIRAARASTTQAWSPNNQPWSSSISHIAYETSTLGSITSFPSGVPSSADSAINQPYVGGNFFRTSGSTFSNTLGNFTTGIGSMVIATALGLHFYQISFIPKIPKTSLDQLVFGPTFFKQSWARGTP
jgi:hypothetical protein